jgi:PAS domain S-box-containing protein
MPLPPEEISPCFHQIEKIVTQEGIFQEVYNQKMLQEALESTRQELHDIMRQQQGTIFKIHKKNNRFIYTLCDGKLMYRMGLTPEQVVGREPKDLLPVEIANELNKYYLRAWKGEENVTYNGEISGIHYLASLSPVRKCGQVVGVIDSCIDITDQKVIEKELQWKNLKYQLLTENILDLVVGVDNNGMVSYASPSHEKVVGIPANEYTGRSVFELVHPEDIGRIETLLSNMAELKSPCQFDFRHKHVKEGWVYLEVKVSPIYGENGELEYFIAVGRDISERKKTEEIMKRSEKLSVVSQLASSIAHEIRNPLTTIKGFVQLLQKEIINPLYIDTTLKEINQIEEIIQEFLEFANLQTSRMEKVDLKILLKQVFKLIYSQSSQRNIEIVQEYELDLPKLLCDGKQIKQVFIHILQNAIEAMPNGGLIHVNVKRPSSDQINVRFIDQGYGISKERIRKIGEPFYSTKEKGTGLGLMISHKIVQEYGGTLEIKSEVNKGTIFDVMLPIKNSIILK